MDYTIDLISGVRHRYLISVSLSNYDATLTDPEVTILLDTGAFNTMIDIDLAKRFGLMLPFTIPVSIGGYYGEAQGCILHKISMGNFEMKQVFAMAYPFKDWLARHIVLGTNVLNNWNFAISRTGNQINFSESIPADVPNRQRPYQNYFKNGEYVAVQDETKPTPPKAASVRNPLI